MPTKAKTTKLPPEEVEVTKKSRRISLKSLGKINVAYILFFLLIIAAFLIGVLFTKVQYLEKGSTTIGGNAVGSGTGSDQAAVQAGPVDVDNGHLPILGNKNAKVTLVEFSDFQCPYCEQLFTESLPQIKKEYIDTGKVKLAYRQYPLTQIHPNAQKAAEASECANDQGKFWEFHDTLFTNQAEWEALDSAGALAKFVEYANNIGIDGNKLGECVSSGKMAGNVKKDLDAGTKVGVSGTPATFVNGILVEGAVPYAEFKTQIDQALSEAK